jgi:thiamine biosynthesis lipoprotein ApbE
MIAASLFGVACIDDEYYFLINNKRFHAFGVYAGLTVVGKKSQLSAANAFYEEYKAVIETADNQLSTSIETSDVAKFNRAGKDEKVYIGEYTKDMYERALELYDPIDPGNRQMTVRVLIGTNLLQERQAEAIERATQEVIQELRSASSIRIMENNLNW